MIRASHRSPRPLPAPPGTSAKLMRCSASTSATHSIRCCFPTASKCIHSSSNSSSPPGSPRPGPVRRNRGSPTPIPHTRPAGAGCVRPGFPIPRIGEGRLPMPDIVDVVLRCLVVLGAFLILPLVVGQMEHKTMAHMQSRVGPMYAGGFHGWAQLIADGVKFIQKEDIVPAAADRTVFKLAPAVALVPYLVAMVAIPLAPGIVGQDLDSGLFFVLAAMSVGVLGLLMGGLASANKYSLLGGMRVAAQLMSYELPFVLSAASVAMAAGTLSLTGIVEAWQPWWLLWQLPGAVVFFVAGLAELQRPPFDMPLADSELVMGPLTEYGGMRFAMFLLAEYAGIVVLAALTTVLFLGGWHGPFGDQFGLLWSLLKIGFVSFLVIWARVAYPRLREDQLNAFAWKVLVPIALGQLALTTVVAVMLSLIHISEPTRRTPTS